MLIKYSQLKKLAHEFDVKPSMGAYSHLEKLVREAIMRAIKKTKSEKKSTLRAEHFEKLGS